MHHHVHLPGTLVRHISSRITENERSPFSSFAIEIVPPMKFPRRERSLSSFILRREKEKYNLSQFYEIWKYRFAQFVRKRAGESRIRSKEWHRGGAGDGINSEKIMLDCPSIHLPRNFISRRRRKETKNSM